MPSEPPGKAAACGLPFRKPYPWVPVRVGSSFILQGQRAPRTLIGVCHHFHVQLLPRFCSVSTPPVNGATALVSRAAFLPCSYLGNSSSFLYSNQDAPVGPVPSQPHTSPPQLVQECPVAQARSVRVRTFLVRAGEKVFLPVIHGCRRRAVEVAEIYAPPQNTHKDVRVLIPGTCGCYLIWRGKKTICICDEVKYLKWTGDPGLSGGL